MTRSFCFGKRTQNHFRPCAAFQRMAKNLAILFQVPSTSTPNKMAQILAALKQSSPKKSIRHSSSAAPDDGKTIVKNDSNSRGEKGIFHLRYVGDIKVGEENNGRMHFQDLCQGQGSVTANLTHIIFHCGDI